MGGPGSQKCCSRLSGGATLENFLETPAAVHLATVVCVVQKSHQGAGETFLGAASSFFLPRSPRPCR